MTKNWKFRSSSIKIHANILTFKKRHILNFQSKTKTEVLGKFQFYVFPKVLIGLFRHHLCP